MENKRNKDLLTEYKYFLEKDQTIVPNPLMKKTLTRVKILLNPSPWIVLLKLLLTHLLVGSLSLSVCHQFGMNPFGTETSLADWFMSMLGHSACMVICGVVFVGASVFAAGFLLSVDELRALKRTEFLQTLALGSASLVAFGLLGANLPLTLVTLWLGGALVGGLLANQAAFKIRNTFC